MTGQPPAQILKEQEQGISYVARLVSCPIGIGKSRTAKSSKKRRGESNLSNRWSVSLISIHFSIMPMVLEEVFRESIKTCRSREDEKVDHTTSMQ